MAGLLLSSSFLMVAVLLFGGAGGCGGGSGVTLPAKSVATNAAVLSASSAISTSLSEISSLQSAALTKASHIPSEESGFVCSTPVNVDATTRRVTCTCPRGGSLTVDYIDPAESGTCPITITSSSTTTYTNCVVEICGGRTTLNGQNSGQVESRRSEISSFQTASACSGITAVPSGGSTFTLGYQINFTDNGVTQTFSGNICVDGESTAFSNREEFEAAFDPGGDCREATGGSGSAASCTDCVSNCVADGLTDAACRSGTCSFLCGETGCNAADIEKCRNAVASLAPTGLETAYRAATTCVERSLPGPCIIDCTRADADTDRCADIFDGLPRGQLTTFGCGCFGPPQFCDFTYLCATTADCPADRSCTFTSGDPPPPNACY